MYIYTYIHNLLYTIYYYTLCSRLYATLHRITLRRVASHCVAVKYSTSHHTTSHHITSHHITLYGQFSTFHVCFCGLDPGNLKFETVRTQRQRICFQDLRGSI